MLSERLFIPFYRKLHVWLIASLIFGSVLFTLPARATVLLSDSPDFEHSQVLPAGEMATFELPDNLLDTTTITHSASQNIMAGNSVACSSDGGSTTTENGYLRTFVLEDFGIFGDFDIVEVSFGLENLSGVGQALDVNIFTLDAEPFIYDNMTLIATESIFLDPQSLTIIELPIEATIPAGSTLVVEVDWPDTSGVSGFFIGSNNLGQTAPSYLRSASCGLPQPTNVADIGFPGMHIVMNVTGSVAAQTPEWHHWMHTCIPAEVGPFAFVKQPWGWVEGVANPDATINATLKRGSSVIASASTTADTTGWFSLEFSQNNTHLDIQSGDQVLVNGGGLNETLTIPEIIGHIDVNDDSIAGQISGVPVPALGDVCVRLPAELEFVSGKTWFDGDGRFGIELGGSLDITFDHLAQVVYEDPNGNYVVEILHPEGLNPRVLIEEGRVEGVTSPDSQITIHIHNAADVHKGSAEITADETGFYSTEIFKDDSKVRIELGDQLTIAKPGHVREMTVNMTHVSYIHPWSDRVFGTVNGIDLPTAGSQGRVDVWNVHEQKWYSQYVWIEPDGKYGADFDGIGNLESGSMIRVWATANDGSQQVALGWDLILGVSTTRNEVWGYTTGNSPVEISLYRGLVSGEPFELIGTAAPSAQPNGYYASQVMAGGQPVAISPSNVVVVNTSDHVRSMFVGQVSADINVVQNRLTVYGPPNAVLHVEGRHPLKSGYVWREVVLSSAGSATISLLDFDILPGDFFDLTCYIEAHGLVIHNIVAAPGQPSRPIYLPIVKRASG